VLYFQGGALNTAGNERSAEHDIICGHRRRGHGAQPGRLVRLACGFSNLRRSLGMITRMILLNFRGGWIGIGNGD